MTKAKPGDKVKYKQAHTDNTKYGMGDYYGTGLTNKIGKIIDVTGFESPKKVNLKKPPKSLA
jgi:hypothetical protein